MADVVVAHKSTVRRWIDKIVNETEDKLGRQHVKQGATIVRQCGESLVVGGALGAIDATAGLDQGGVPLDFAGSVAAGFGAMYFAGEEFAEDLRNSGATAAGIFSFRKTKELMTMKKTAVGLEDSDSDEGSDADVGEEDPIVSAAKEL